MNLDQIAAKVEKHLPYFRSICNDLFAQVEAYGKKLDDLTQEARKRPRDTIVRVPDREDDGTWDTVTYKGGARHETTATGAYDQGTIENDPGGWIYTQPEDYYCLNITPIRCFYYEPPRLVHPLSWFRVIKTPHPTGRWTDTERLLCDCLKLAVAHDNWCLETQSCNQRVFYDIPYPGTYFRRDYFCGALWSKMEHSSRRDADLAAAWNHVNPAARMTVERELTAQAGSIANTGTPQANMQTPHPMEIPRWPSKCLNQLREIDSDPRRNGIPGDKTTLKRLREYVGVRHQREDIAGTLYLGDGRIKTKMPHRTMFKDESS